MSADVAPMHLSVSCSVWAPLANDILRDSNSTWGSHLIPTQSEQSTPFRLQSAPSDMEGLISSWMPPTQLQTAPVHAGGLHSMRPLVKALSWEEEAIYKTVFFWPKLKGNGLRQSGELFYGQMNWKLFVNHGHSVLWTTEESDHPACYESSVQKPASLLVFGGALVPLELETCTSGKAPSVLTGIYRF